MFLFRSLPICLLLLVLGGISDGEAKSASGNTKLPRLVRRARTSAARRTHSLARDLRVALGGVLPRAESSSPRHVVYCKGGNQGVLNGGGGNNGGGTTTSGGEPTTVAGNSTSQSLTRGGSTRTTTTPRPTSVIPSSTPGPTSLWRLTKSYEGQSFFEGWNFFTGADPTRGTVQYVDEGTGRARGLVEVNSAGNAIMRVDTTPTISGNRMSIRIESEVRFTGGIVLMDAVHMPFGCGTWPAFWTNGPDPWPSTGEIDILEGVHDNTNNQATLHTAVGCTIPSSSSNALGISGALLDGTDCAVEHTENRGCGVRAPSSNTYGRGFNTNGGGVYAMKWDTTGIAVYFFPRGSIPDDVSSGNLLPDTWGAPQARWPASTCDPFRFFREHHTIFDTTFCGDWAGEVWNAAGSPGQEQSCAQRTGFSTCEAFVRANGASFAEAYWEVRYVKIYQLRN